MLDVSEINTIIDYLKKGGLDEDSVIIKKLVVMKDQLELDKEVRTRAAEIRERISKLNESNESAK